MAKQTSIRKLTANQLIIRKLKDVWDSRAIVQDGSSNVWVMVVAAIPFDHNILLSIPHHNPSPTAPTHHIRIILRTSDKQSGTNPYVDGSDFYLAVDVQSQTAEFVWEEESFSDSPQFRRATIIHLP